MSTAPSFDNSYARLPNRFFKRLSPRVPKAPNVVRINDALAEVLGLDPDYLTSPEGLGMLSGQSLPDAAEPLAMAYAGHQFGSFSPQLGDGRAHLIGEIIGRDEVRYDIQLKGSGHTPFSRMGDGLAALGPVLREYIISEAMNALGVPTTRSLAAVTTGDHVVRETVQPGAVLTRVARGHIRVGTFEYFAVRQDFEALVTLARYALARFYPDASGTENPAKALLDNVITAQAKLVAQWMSLGFIHGVMNTDNCSISGETIDYGPCAFIDEFHPGRVYSSIDHAGRYAYGNQPSIAHWNLARLAQALLPILHTEQDKALALAQEAIDAYPAQFEAEYLRLFRGKLGLEQSDDGDLELIQGFLGALKDTNSDFTNSFRMLGSECGGADADEPKDILPGGVDGLSIKDWLGRWRERCTTEGATDAQLHKRLIAANPAYIPRNHRVEEALNVAVSDGDFAPFRTLLDVLEKPHIERKEFAVYQNPPKPEEVVPATFCGT